MMDTTNKELRPTNGAVIKGLNACLMRGDSFPRGAWPPLTC